MRLFAIRDFCYTDFMGLAGYEVYPIDSATALDIAVRHHYLHRRAPASHCFGLFDREASLVGVAIYGTPASRNLCSGIAGEEEKESVIELTRLWIADFTPRNAESFLISRSLKQLPASKNIVVSYAEIGAGHIGTIYQATNWIYTGLSDRHVIWHIDGEDGGQHQRHLFDKAGGIKQAKHIYGNRMIASERPRKHRYIFLRGSKKRVRELRAKLRYSEQPYPKMSNNSNND